MMTIREELFHPLFTHFPIVILFLALVFKALSSISLRVLDEYRKHFVFIYKACLYIGPLLFIITMYLGDMALDQVKAGICSLMEAYKHEQYAYEALYLFMAAVFFDVLSSLDKVDRKVKTVLSYVCLLMIFIGNYLMFQSAHSGALLVYEQGAAVKVATPDCNK